MNVTFYLMSQKGIAVMQALIDNNLQSLVSEIVVGRDKHIENDFADEIIQICKKQNIKYRERAEKNQTTSDYSIAVSWKWLIPDNSSQLIVLHDSLLPKYRGFAPLVTMLCKKENKIGVSAIFATQEYDKGDIIAQSSTQINYPIKIKDAIHIISQNYIELTLKIVSAIAQGEKLNAIPQDESKASYSLWRDEIDYQINWQKDADEILNFINAVSSPYKGAATFMNGNKKIRILEAEIETDVKIENRDVGKIIFLKNKYPVVVCGTGLLKLLKIIDDKTKEDLLPFNHIRKRFTNYFTELNI